MRKKTDYLYIGMDTHKETHTAVLMTYMEERVGEIEIQNNLKGFQRLTAYVEKCQKKKQLVHRRNALVKTKSALVQQFHDQIQYDYPSYKKFFTDIECNTSIAFFEQYPSSRTLKHTTVEELERIDKLQKKLLKEVDYHLETLPGVNTVTACALVGQIGDISRFKSANKLANYAGVAPVCFSSAGKGKYVQNKSQGNRELYSVLYLLAMQQVHVNTKGQARNPLLRAYFESKVSEGKTKIQALLCIMRRLVNIIYSMIKNKTAYRMPEIIISSTEEKEQVIS